MNGIDKYFENFFWLVGQIFPVAFGGIILGVLSYLIDPWLLLLLLSPVTIHLCSGFFFGAKDSWGLGVITLLALLQLPIVFVTIGAKVDELAGFIWIFILIYVLASLVWTFLAWLVGAMAISNDWI